MTSGQGVADCERPDPHDVLPWALFRMVHGFPSFQAAVSFREAVPDKGTPPRAWDAAWGARPAGRREFGHFPRFKKRLTRTISLFKGNTGLHGLSGPAAGC